MYLLTVKADFAAAHALRGYKGACESLHGHNWIVELTLSAAVLDEVGLGIDFKEMKNQLNAELERFDHGFLNEVEPFERINPSSENISRVLYERLSKRLNSDNVKVVEVALWETPNSRAAYRP
ncbi:MAG: 6-carboxytetrahydropterin synthase QueD [Candidatus Alcyoniella australis]|nr:6-carboxytetrahydropterin synthase QueD [Candidatus Alcyoniella australis]